MKVQLSLHAKDLANKAGRFQTLSDPFAVVTLLATTEGEQPQVLGQTEIIKNSLDPKWTKMFIFDYDLGSLLHFVVSIYDHNKDTPNEIMGSAKFEIGNILASKGNVIAKKMSLGGTLYAQVEKNLGAGTLKLKMQGKQLANTEGWLKKPDPFYIIRRLRETESGESWVDIHRSTPVMDTINPVWDDVHLDLSVLCSGDLERPIKIMVYDHEKQGAPVFIGSIKTTVNEIVAASGDTENGLALTMEGNDRGKLIVTSAKLDGYKEPVEEAAEEEDAEEEGEDGADAVKSSSKPNFVDYISGGCEINMCVAIDFTGSNGDPREPGTLHYYSDEVQNDYEKAIVALGSILSRYDSNKKFPVLGFGAKFSEDDEEANHCFQIGAESEVDGIEGILQAYHDVFQPGLIMSRPTDITEVMRKAAERAVEAEERANEEGRQVYTVILIITDGAVSDVEATAEALDEICESPLSVVIVGVGDGDFEGMEFLDERKASGECRDIAQFVQFNAHDNVKSLAAATLNEIPGQLVNYFEGKEIMPLPKVHKDHDEVEAIEAEEDIDLCLEFGEGNAVTIASGGFHTS